MDETDTTVRERLLAVGGAPSEGPARFTAALAVTTGGIGVGVGALTFQGQTERWLGFAVGAVLVVVLMAAFAVRGRGTVQRLLDLPTVLTCVWLMMSTRAVESSGAGSSPHAVKWLNLSAGAMLCGAGLLGLLLHEWRVERDLRRGAGWYVSAVPRATR